MTPVELPFGREDVSWGVLRQPIYLLGGMRALLLQLAEAGIAAGVAEHSDFVDRLFFRLQRTLDLMVVIGLGGPEESTAALDSLQRAHVGVSGTLPDGSTYDAGDPGLRLWVLATLVDTVLTVERRYIGEFDERLRHRYYFESMAVGRVLGVSLPPGLAAFRTYMRDRVATLVVSDAARMISRHVMYPRLPLVPPAVFGPLRPLTTEMLDDRLRAAYGLTLSSRQVRWVRRTQRISRLVLPKLPDGVRTFPVLHPIQGLQQWLWR